MPSRLLVPILSGFFDLGLFLKAFFKAADSLAQAFSQLREALRSEDEKTYGKDDDELLHTKTEHKIVSFSRVLLNEWEKLNT